MKKSLFLLPLLVLSFTSCKKDTSHTISIACSQKPHAEILNSVCKQALKEKGYTLEVTVLDWSIMNEETYQGTYDGNYFQHRPFLQNYDGDNNVYLTSYTYTKLFPAVTVHFEPLRIYEGKKTASEFENVKKSAKYCICNDVSNEIRALDLLKDAGVIDNYELDKGGTPIKLPSNIVPLAESELALSILDYDYGVLPVNSALTGGLEADDTLPTENDTVADKNANVLALNVKKYENDNTYKTKMDALCDSLLSSDVASFIKTTYKGVISTYQKDLRK